MLPTSSKRNWRGWDERCSRLVTQSARTTKALVVDRAWPSESELSRAIENNLKPCHLSTHSPTT